MTKMDMDILQMKQNKMADLHCHLLPGIDDGAKDEFTSLNLLRTQINSGVNKIALTSHFNCEKISLDNFETLRKKAFDRMMKLLLESEIDTSDLVLKLGAEVLYSPSLSKINLRRLCLENTNIMLLELPTNMFPAFFDETIFAIQSQGITPVIAHIERYPYVMKNPTILCEWIDQGIYTQVNAETILMDDKQTRLCMKLIKWNLVHVLASDAHSVNQRPPNYIEGITKVSTVLGKDAAELLKENANALFEGKMPDIDTIHYPKKMFGIWR